MKGGVGILQWCGYSLPIVQGDAGEAPAWCHHAPKMLTPLPENWTCSCPEGESYTRDI